MLVLAAEWGACLQRPTPLIVTHLKCKASRVMLSVTAITTYRLEMLWIAVRMVRFADHWQ